MPGCTPVKESGTAAKKKPADSCKKDKEKCPFEKKLTGEILEVHFKSGIKVAYKKKTVKAPHWKKGTNVIDGAGSKRPGVYLVESAGGKHDMMVKVKITESENISGSGELSAKLGALEMTGTCPTSKGEHKVPVKIKKLPDSIQWYQGDPTWKLDVKADGISESLKHATRLEVFVVLDTPATYYQGKKGVWTKALRFLCGPVGLVGTSTHKDVAKAVTRYCHGSHGLTYHTGGGAPAYGCNKHGGTFQLDSYIDASLTVINCYDQAAAVQSLCGAVGTPITWIYQDPYGYIQTTDLVGVGTCNNPFYTYNGSSKVIGVNDSKRLPFSNHAFCEHSARIFDACAGPHLGTETRAQYVGNSIDTVTTLYPTSPYVSRAGTVADMSTHSGVTSVT